jgi:ADP-ribose pyrophosphatase YjhB (NUDIX family)
LSIRNSAKAIVLHEGKILVNRCSSRFGEYYALPGGGQRTGDMLQETVKRELLEETGFGGGTWTEFMSICANPSNHTNLAHTFLAVGVERVCEQHLDATEELTCHVLSQDEVFGMLQRGEIFQALMAAPLWRFFYERR